MIAILFSFEQKGFHIETMEEYIDSNIRVTMYGKDHQWRLVAIANTEFQADEICEKLSKKEPFKTLIAC